MLVSQKKTLVARWRKMSAALALSLLLFIVTMGIVACTGPNFGGSSDSSGGGGGGTTATSTPSPQALSKLSWCGKPLVLFRDEGAVSSPTATGTSGTPVGTATASSTPTGTVIATATAGARTITDWSQVKPYLGFTVYLPPTLPAHTCLVSVSGTIHDPIFGGSFIIGYLLPDHSAISLSEAPLRSQSQQFQCSPSSTASGTPTASGTAQSGTATPGTRATATPVAMQLCSGAKGNTNIFFSAPGTTAQLQQLFNALQPDVDWMPSSS